jgi:hypothetical protein
MTINDHETDLKCSDVEEALQVIFKGALERRVLVSVDTKKTYREFSDSSWHVAYASSNIKAMLQGWLGETQRLSTNHVQKVAPYVHR